MSVLVPILQNRKWRWSGGHHTAEWRGQDLIPNIIGSKASALCLCQCYPVDESSETTEAWVDGMMADRQANQLCLDLSLFSKTPSYSTLPCHDLYGEQQRTPVFFFFFTFFLIWTIFQKVFIGFVTILLLLYVLVLEPWDIWDLSSWTRDGTCTPCTTGRRSLNPSPARRLSRAPVLKLICLSPSEPQVPESKSTTLEAISPGAVTTLPFPAKGQRGI